MLITRLVLKNVKSYRQAEISFQRGTNVIAGNNGAGKTTILESIGYVLFDHRPYRKKELLLRHGEKDGKITVSILAEDQREYQVVRHIGRSKYFVFDPETETKLAEGREEVLSWLSMNLGLGDEEEELSALFRNAVGVEQGLMTAPFLDTPEERKRKFMPLLKVEGYKKAYKEAGGLLKFIRERMIESEKKMENLKGRLQGHGEKQEALQGLEEQMKKLASRLVVLREGFEGKRARLEELETRQREVLKLTQEMKGGKILLQRLQAELELAARELSAAREAAGKLEASREDHDAYLRGERHLAALEKQRQRFMEAQEKILQLEKKLAGLRQEIRHQELQLEELEGFRREKDCLKPHYLKEKELKTNLEMRLPTLGLLEKQGVLLRTADQELRNREQELQRMKQELSTLPGLEKELGELEGTQEELDKVTGKLADLNSALEQEHKKQANLSLGICPFFDDPCPKVGQEPERFQEETREHIQELQDRLATTRNRITTLKKRREEGKTLQSRYHRLSERREQMTRLETELQKKQRSREEALAEKERLERGAAELGSLKAKLGEVREEAGHSSIRSRWEFLQGRLKEEAGLKTRLSETRNALVALAKERGSEEERRSKFQDAEAKMADQRKLLERLKSGHDNFIINQQSAGQLPTREERHGNLRKARETRLGELTRLEVRLKELGTIYNKEEHLVVEKTFKRAQQELHTLQERQKAWQENLEQLKNELKRMESLQKELLAIEVKQEEDQRLSNFVAFFREQVFRKVPNTLVRVYLERINREAVRIFHELMGKPMLELNWSNDFEITVREGATESHFSQLSGGQQMCAALAVRLALLRTLSGVKLAFFDEPTQNLDEERRENLAAAVRSIGGFEQLFIISHDETFHDLVEHTIYLRNEEGETTVGESLA